MFLREQQGLELAGAAGARSFGRALAPTEARSYDRFRAVIAEIDLVPDLGAQIGTRSWWRGVATCTALCAATWALSPGFDRPIVGAVPAPASGAAWEEARTQAIAPLGLGAGTGRRMAAGDLVRPLAETPERPTIDLTATLGEGDDFGRMLQRAGVGRNDAEDAAALVSQAVDLGEIKPGTVLDLTLGRRASKTVARPLEKLAFRAKFDLNLSVLRAGQRLTLDRQPIAVDHTPWRIQGLVGSSLYRSARAAGVPAKAVEGYIKALATKLSIGSDVRAADTFDIIIERARAATGEVQLGDIQFAGLDQGRRKLQLMRWGTDGEQGWWDANGQSERRGFMAMPVAGHVTSSFGMRFHPILGFNRMHKGIDIGAPWGSPIYAAIDGVVTFAARTAGYGNFVKLNHGGGIMTGYGHMSRIAVRSGTRVARGQVIGFVGSTGMSTGPHLHWEVWKNGVAVNPMGVSLSSVAVLSGSTLRAFKARVANLLAVQPGAR